MIDALHPGGRRGDARRGSRPKRLGKLKIREKIRALVWKRLEIMGPAREAVRRALAILAMPQNVPTGAARSAGARRTLMWRIAGDTAPTSTITPSG